jgi:hypothetical protein
MKTEKTIEYTYTDTLIGQQTASKKTTYKHDKLSSAETIVYEYDEHGNIAKISETYEEFPAEPKREPVTLYCVKGYKPYLTQGKTYHIDANGGFTDDKGFTSHGYASFADFKNQNPNISACLVECVKRPAKVGEWVYITEDRGGDVHAGKIFKVSSISGSVINLVGGWCILTEYLVLDGYQPEPEKKPEPQYYNGKIVCIDNDGYDHWTVGKVYSIVNGVCENDHCDGSYIDAPIQSLEDIRRWTSAKFIEYKGEQS